jgi:hypothetical protein
MALFWYKARKYCSEIDRIAALRVAAFATRCKGLDNMFLFATTTSTSLATLCLAAVDSIPCEILLCLPGPGCHVNFQKTDAPRKAHEETLVK